MCSGSSHGGSRCPACTRAAPRSASGHPALSRGLRAQSCTYCHVTAPWIKGTVSKHIWTKKFQDFECIGGLELVLRRRDATTYLEVRSLVREDLWGKTPGVPRWLFNHLGEMVRKERRKWWGCFAVGYSLPPLKRKKSSRPLFLNRSPAFTKGSPGTFKTCKY